MVKKTLRDLVHEHLELEELLDDPEIPDEAIRDTLEATEGLMADKIDAIGKLIRHWSSLDEGLKDEIQRLQGRRRMFANRVGRLKGYLLYALGRLNEPRVETGMFTVRVQRGQEVAVIDDLELIPAELVEVAVEPRKAEIKAQLKAGSTVPGAHLERGADYVVIR